MSDSTVKDASKISWNTNTTIVAVVVGLILFLGLSYHCQRNMLSDQLPYLEMTDKLPYVGFHKSKEPFRWYGGYGGYGRYRVLPPYAYRQYSYPNYGYYGASYGYPYGWW